MLHWPECHAILANGNTIGSLRWCDIDFGQMACWFFDYATLLWLDHNQIACQAHRSSGRLIRRRRVHQISIVVVKIHYFRLKTWVDSVGLFLIKSQNVWTVQKANATRTQWTTATEGSSITEGGSRWFNEVAWVLDISSVWAFNACWQPQYES